MRRVSFFLTLFLAVVLAVPVIAQPPSTMSYQGVLTDAGGNLVSDAPYSLTFRLYDLEAGGAALWTETVGVTTTKGGFSVVLGSTVPMTIPFDKQYWLSVQVAADPELAPRTKLGSSPYALNLRFPISQNVSNAAPLLSLRNSGAGPAMVADPELFVGGAENGVLQVFRAGVAGRLVEASTAGVGGNVRTYDEAGNVNNEITSDGDGEGSFIAGYRGTTQIGLLADLNDAGSNEPSVTISGSARSAAFRMGQTGNASVALPADAIDALEQLEEPGVAAENATNTTGMDGSIQSLLSRTITVPAAGYCIVIGTAEVSLSHTNGIATSTTFGVSAIAGTFPGTQDVLAAVPPTAVSGIYVLPVTVHGVFQVGAGANTFHLLGQRGATGAASFADRQLSIVFVPTAYGTVTATVPAEGPGAGPQDDSAIGHSLTAGDIQAEQEAARRFHEARLQRELSEMRARFEKLEREMKDSIAAQARAAAEPRK